MKPKIEKGIPVPEKGRPKYGFRTTLGKMRPGDSVFFSGADTRNLWQAGELAFGRGNFTTRREGEGARIWRLR